MSKMQSLTITLPEDLAERLKSMVASGEYDSESEIVVDGLRELFAEDPAIERWITEEVIPTYDSWKSGSVKTRSAEEVRERLDAHIDALIAKQS